MKINIPSETDHLNAVIVHTPGREVSLVNPELKEELLFDDIIFEDDARREHLSMQKVFEAAMPGNGKIFEITDLARECFAEQSVREEFIELMIRELPSENIHTVEKKLSALDGNSFVAFIAEGSFGGKFSLQPAPNMLFTRDLAAVAGQNIILSRAARKARVREFLMMNMIVQHHPLFEGIRHNIITVGGRQSIEGGDVLVAAPNILLIGMSERTSFSGLMSVAEKLLYRGIDHIVAVDIPKQRSSMHLDTIFTFTDETECVVFPPAITGQTHNVVHLFSSGDFVQARQCRSLRETLGELTGREFTFINCGGAESVNQYREQWTDGANLFALAPGVVVGYGRNTQTFRELEKFGYVHKTQHEFIEEFENKTFNPAQHRKTAISFEGHELCRGRGGARCMTLPIARTIAEPD